MHCFHYADDLPEFGWNRHKICLKNYTGLYFDYKGGNKLKSNVRNNYDVNLLEEIDENTVVAGAWTIFKLSPIKLLETKGQFVLELLNAKIIVNNRRSFL